MLPCVVVSYTYFLSLKDIPLLANELSHQRIYTLSALLTTYSFSSSNICYATVLNTRYGAMIRMASLPGRVNPMTQYTPGNLFITDLHFAPIHAITVSLL